MNLSDFNFDLPDHLIARRPADERDGSRLLVIENESRQDAYFHQLSNYLRTSDLLVFNNTKTLPARLLGYKNSGGAVEVMVEQVKSLNQARALIRSNRTPSLGQKLVLADGNIIAEVIARDANLFQLSFEVEGSLIDALLKYGELPLPPYMNRAADEADKERYQTIYAKHYGAVATPTAGLHFTQSLLSQLSTLGIQSAELTLHVGAGTFLPIKTDNVDEHVMHYEGYELSEELVKAIKQTQRIGGRVVAVGTTVVRALEGVCQRYGQLQPNQGETNLFIKPGFQFQVVDALITNFHLPKSTLLMLVSAFAGKKNISSAYQHAIRQSYRFFSYGDAMFLQRTEG